MQRAYRLQSILLKSIKGKDSTQTRLLSKPPFVISGYVWCVSAVISVIRELDFLEINSMGHDWQVMESVAAVGLMIRSKKIHRTRF